MIKGFGCYECSNIIYTGKSSIVYEVLHRQSGQKFAFKVFNKDVLEEYIIEEYKILDLFKNKKDFLPFYGATYFHEHFIFRMRKSKNGNLKTIIESQGVMTELVAKNMLLNIAKQLKVAHRKNIIHNNIKPENIIFDESRYYLIDWSEARSGKSIYQDINLSDNLFIAPEHYKCQLSYKTDIYMLGHLLYYVLHGNLLYDLFPDMIESYIMLNHLSKEPIYDKNLSHEIINLLNGMLGKELKDRMTLEDVIHYLEKEEFKKIYKIKTVKLPSELSSDEDIYHFFALKEIMIAQFKYAIILENQKKYENSIKIYIYLASKNFTKAMNNLGYLYENGLSVKKDYRKSNYWYSKSAKLGDSRALYNLALSYEFAKGVKKDINHAKKLYKQSFRKGYLKAREKSLLI